MFFLNVFKHFFFHFFTCMFIKMKSLNSRRKRRADHCLNPNFHFSAIRVSTVRLCVLSDGHHPGSTVENMIHIHSFLRVRYNLLNTGLCYFSSNIFKLANLKENPKIGDLLQTKFKFINNFEKTPVVNHEI